MGHTVTFQVQGMDCDACERRLRTVLSRMDGVAQADDHTTGVVRVRFGPSRVALDALAAAVSERIEQAGFTVTSHEQPRGEAARS